MALKKPTAKQKGGAKKKKIHAPARPIEVPSPDVSGEEYEDDSNSDGEV